LRKGYGIHKKDSLVKLTNENGSTIKALFGFNLGKTAAN
jgi:hypothetical protein